MKQLVSNLKPRISLLLVLILILAGCANSSTPGPMISASPKQSTIAPTQKIATPAPAQASIELISLTSPISHGRNATIAIKGKANTEYNITVKYKSGPSTAAGLGEKTSDSSGRVSWTWKVGTRTTRGSWPITISGGGQSATFNFTVD